MSGWWFTSKDRRDHGRYHTEIHDWGFSRASTRWFSFLRAKPYSLRAKPYSFCLLILFLRYTIMAVGDPSPLWFLLSSPITKLITGTRTGDMVRIPQRHRATLYSRCYGNYAKSVKFESVGMSRLPGKGRSIKTLSSLIVAPRTQWYRAGLAPWLGLPSMACRYREILLQRMILFPWKNCHKVLCYEHWSVATAKGQGNKSLHRIV